MRLSQRIIFSLGTLLALGGCTPAEDSTDGSTPLLVDVTAQTGITFKQETGATGKKFLFETMGSGVAISDFDGDDLPDILFLQGGTLPEEEVTPAERKRASHHVGATPRLYKNLGGWRFRDVTHEAGLDLAFYAHGIAVGDIDGDGDRDVYAAAYGKDRIFLNDGAGRFSEEGSARGIEGSHWTIGGCFFDADGDGDLDLYSVSYLDMPIESHQFCGPRDLRTYCHVDFWKGVDDRLYRNDGQGYFTDVSAEAGLLGTKGKGLAVVASDLDGDSDLDLFIANDSDANLVLRNDGTGKFEDISRWSGADLNREGKTEACMGIAAGDMDNDGDLDLYITNFEQESNTLYRNDGGGFFTDISISSGSGVPSISELGFGTACIDLENDGDLDLYVANGHIMDNVELYQEHTLYAQADHVYFNDGTGRFVRGEENLGPSLHEKRVGRGLATGDLDRDGDLDLIITNMHEGPWILRNDMATHHRIALRLLGPGNRSDAEGAKVMCALPGGATFVREILSGTSYASHSDTEVILGLGEAQTATLSIHWPDGRETDLGEVAADQRLTIDWDGQEIGRENLP